MLKRLLFFLILWTLALLFLGSVVHATGASLACPDWPTCFGTMMPEMTGGVFWEHLHRLWAGALVLLFIYAVVLLRRQLPERTDLLRMGVAGFVLLLVQSLVGGLTVIYRLPDAVSTTHLALAFAFLALLTAMTVRVADANVGAARRVRASRLARRAGIWIAGVGFVQSVVGAAVRHTDAGVACPDVPLCLGRVIPPFEHPLVVLHFSHRLLGVALAIVALCFAWLVWTRVADRGARRLAMSLSAVVVAQVLLGFYSVAYHLRPSLVSSHTLLAAVLITLSVALAARSSRPLAFADPGGARESR